jgi:hypothetical protein
MMNDMEVRAAVVAAYKVKYPFDTNVIGTEVSAFSSGNLVFLTATDSNGALCDEMCYIDKNGAVSLFDTDSDLAKFIERNSKRPVWVALLERPLFIAILTLILFGVLVILSFKEHADPQLNGFVAAGFSSVMGFWFGTSNSKTNE